MFIFGKVHKIDHSPETIMVFFIALKASSDNRITIGTIKHSLISDEGFKII